MNFLRRQLPVILAFAVGILLWVQFFVPTKASEQVSEFFNQNWGPILYSAALVLGYLSAVHYHLNRVRTRKPGFGYSVITLSVFFIAVIVGLFPIHIPGFAGTARSDDSLFDWIFKNMFIPLSATMFATLAFFIASAAFRAFRARSPEATALLIAGCVMMIARVPLGEQLTIWPFGDGWTVAKLGEWILNNPASAAQRGILIGVTLSQIAISLRIIFGVERTYMGGAD